MNYNGVFPKKYSHQSHECTKVTLVTAHHPFKTALKAAALLLATAGLMTAGSPATGAGTHLCDGYASCAAKGMGNGGYAAVNNRMYWRMYSGHNCTNYVAYRMIANGMGTERPWSGGGNAMYWGRYMDDITDDVPRVGAVAWWNDGSPGHVAYVEKVISPNEIIISQDSWGGDFSWARVTRSYRWPAGFIHFNDRSMTNSTAPRASGLPKVGGSVTATAGTWNPAPTSVDYKWYVDGDLLPRATQPTVKLTSGMVGKSLKVTVVAHRSGYPDRSATTTVTDAILPGSLSATAAPRLSGLAKVGRTLSATTGTWSPGPVTTSYQWLLDGKRVAGATSQKLTLKPAAIGKKVSFVVTAKRAGYASQTMTVTSGKVLAENLHATRKAALSGTSLRGETLKVTPGAVKEKGASSSVQWTRDGVAIPGATERTYQPRMADVGHVVGATVTYAKSGYESLTESLTGRTVKGTVRLTMERIRVRDGIVFDVVATVAGQRLTAPTAIDVRWSGKLKDKAVLRNGHARLRVTDMPRGDRKLWFRVSPTDVSVFKISDRTAWFR
jgi:surface antigen